MNGVRKRRFPVTVGAVCSILVLVVSVVTAQQVFDGNRQPAFVRRQTIFPQQQPNQVQFPSNRNFVLPSASPLRSRNLFTRQISHRLRPRQRSTSSSKSFRSPTHPAHLTSRRVIQTLSHKRTRSRVSSSSSRTKPTVNANQRTATMKSNISRRPQFQPRPVFTQRQQTQPQFQFRRQPFQRVQRVQTFQRAPNQFMRQGVTRSPFALRAPLSPMPFGAVQRTPSSLRRPSNRLSLRPPLTPSTQTPLTTTTTPIPPSPLTSPIPTTTTQPVSLPSSIPTIHSVGGSLRRPIRVQQLQLNLRRKPQMTRGQFRRPNSKFPSTRHQPTHRVTKPDRITRPLVTTTTTEASTTTEVTTAQIVASTTPEGIQQEANDLKKVDDIEAAILQALTETSSVEPPPSTTHRQRIHRIRPGQRHRPASSPQRVDAIEEAVLRAVLEATPSAPEDKATTVEEITTTQEPTTLKTESTSLFPAFASRRHGHRRPTTVLPTTAETTTESTTIETTTEPATTTTTEESTTIVTEGTTTEQVTGITIALPDEEFEEINVKSDSPQLHQIEENVISALSTPTSTVSPSPIPPSPLPPSSSSSPAPPSPPAAPREFSSLQVGPPGSMPPSDDIVDELNDSSDFLQVAQRLHLLRRLLQ